MTEKILRELIQVGAAVTDEDGFLQQYMKGVVYPHPSVMFRMCSEMARRFVYNNVNVVVASSERNIVFAQWISYFLTNCASEREVLCICTEKKDVPGSALWYFCIGIRQWWKSFPQFGRCPEKIASFTHDLNGKNIVVIEEELNYGSSIWNKRVVQEIRQRGGNVIGVGAVCNRGITPRYVDETKIISLVALRP